MKLPVFVWLTSYERGWLRGDRACADRGRLSGRPTMQARCSRREVTVWFYNLIVFSLLFWELDTGGAPARAHGARQHPDLLFRRK